MKIFISSTYKDLKDERSQAINIIDRVGQAVAMEKWFAEAKAPITVALNKLKECNALVLILGFKYGSINENEKISITELEYNTAKALGLPVFVFQKHHSDDKWRSEEQNEEVYRKINAFKSRLDSEDNHRATFKTPQELATEIMGSIHAYGKENDSIGNEKLTDKWFKEYLDIATCNLGERYNPKLNFELEIAKIFDGIARDEKFEKQFRNRLNEFIITLKKNKINIKDKIVNEGEEELHKKLESLTKLYNNIPFDSVDHINYDKMLEKIDEIESVISKIESKINELHESDINKNDERIFDSALYYLKNTFSSLNNFRDFINSDMVKLTNKPFLLLNGEAGIGKSHLLGDIANKRAKENKKSILLLGQHFITNEDPWAQIFRQLKLDSNVNEFLGALESKAQEQGSRIIIFIDAINEGNGKLFWPDQLPGFIRSFKNYKWLGLVLSIRDSYVKLIAPKTDSFNDLIVRHTHYGFKNVEYKASKLFFENYKIEQPSIPLLYPEFQRPLFLKILCDGLKKSGLNRIPDGMQGITKIINLFINSINKRLADPKEFNYPESINVVDKVVKKLIEYKLNNDLYYMPFEKAFTLITDLQKKYNVSNNMSDTFMGRLISEGIISEDLHWKDEDHEDIVYITYDKFEDHITVSYLLDGIDKTSLTNEFEEGGNLYKFVKDSRSLNLHRGIIEALSIQLPEKFGKELYELMPDFNDLDEWDKNNISVDIAESFVSSLLWRKRSTITEKVYDYIDNVVLCFNGTYDLFWDAIISVAPLHDHLFNADKTHEMLSSYSLEDRDAWWTQEIHYGCAEGSAIRRLIEWACSFEDKSHISNESIRLSSIMLAWFLTSTNRRLRDSATKALISLLENRINVLIQVLIKFEGVNDPYIYERLFAVAYGCALRTENIESLKELSEYIYKTIFDKDLVYPHVLLRDYARNVIEYTLYLKINLDIDVNKIRPPYKSNFPIIPKDEEIESYKLSYNPEDPNDYNISQNLILHSMEVERTRNGKGAPYGDFGRYVFQGNFVYWKQLDPINLKNIAIKKVLDLGYDVQKHGEFDKRIQKMHYNRHYIGNERIGKKYQWLAMHELLAQVADNYKMKDGWSQNEDELIDFQGPWVPFVRDIDPTVLKYKKESPKPDFPYFEHYYDKWKVDNESWLKIDDFPDPEGLINISLDDFGWLLLEGNLDWKEPTLLGNEEYSYPQKFLWYQIRSYLVKREDFELIIQELSDKNFMGRWMPESLTRYEIFNREFYWSPAYNYFLKNYYNGNYTQKIEDRPLNRSLGDVLLTTESNSWESEYDKSNEDSSGLKLCNEIFNSMNLKYGTEEGILYSQKNEKICWDLSEFYSTGYNLLIRKDDFLDFLEKNNYCIFWTVLGEKDITGNYDRDNGWPSVSAVYYLGKNRNLMGTLNKF